MTMPYICNKRRVQRPETGQASAVCVYMLIGADKIEKRSRNNIERLHYV